MTAWLTYIRVSTKEQTENLSLPTQLRVCEEDCRREGLEILERFKEEGESAKTTDRHDAAHASIPRSVTKRVRIAQLQ